MQEEGVAEVLDGIWHEEKLTFVTTYGVRMNMYSQRVSNQVTLDDLFER